MPYYFIKHSKGKIIKKSANFKKAIIGIPEDAKMVSLVEINQEQHNICLDCDEMLNRAVKFCNFCGKLAKVLK